MYCQLQPILLNVKKNCGFSSKTASKKKQYNQNVETEAMQPRTKEKKKKTIMQQESQKSQ